MRMNNYIEHLIIIIVILVIVIIYLLFIIRNERPGEMLRNDKRMIITLIYNTYNKIIHIRYTKTFDLLSSTAVQLISV